MLSVIIFVQLGSLSGFLCTTGIFKWGFFVQLGPLSGGSLYNWDL